MKAIVIEPNKDMVWKEVENPVLKCGEVLGEVFTISSAPNLT